MEGGKVVNDGLHKIKDYFNIQKYSNVTAICKNKSIYLHQFLLATQSKVFERMFYGSIPFEGSSLNMEDESYEELLVFFQYLYGFETGITVDNVTSLLYLSDKFDVPSLSNHCLSFLKSHLDASSTSTFFIFHLASKFSKQELIEKSFNIIKKKLDHFDIEDFKHLSETDILQIVSSDELMISEYDLLVTIQKWITINDISDKAVIDKIISMIRLPLIPKEQFVTDIKPFVGELISSEKYIEILEYHANPKLYPSLCPVSRVKLATQYQVQAIIPQNFHPQDVFAVCGKNEFAFAFHSSSEIKIFKESEGTLTLKKSIPGEHHSVSLSYWDDSFYLVDYSTNSASIHQIKNQNKEKSIFQRGALGYGGCPICINQQYLWRTTPSSSYTWSNLNTIQKFKLSDPSTKLIEFIAPCGVGSICIGKSEDLWILEYVHEKDTCSVAKIYSLHPDHGKVLRQLSVDIPPNLRPCGLSYDTYHDRLLLFCFNEKKPDESLIFAVV
eukprot:TRINITY_DN2651_c0_g1_i2.p1 TRINITY_DN2651_c0_g1~~TRINITY_DN2651_c0_g1_i2.p1  ORF type:complete len:508 (+),score=132.08 TRINITY_DN2651_c0_g1_i2:28-1524(+)